MSVSGERDFIRLVTAKNLAGFMSQDDIEDVAIAFKKIERITAIASDALAVIEGDPLVTANKVADALGLGSMSSINASWRKSAARIERLLKSTSWAEKEPSYLLGPSREKIEANSYEIECLIRAVEAENLIGAASIIGTDQDRAGEFSGSGAMGYDELIEARDGILAALDDEMLRADDDTDLYKALEAGRIAAWDDMTARAEKSARIVNYTPAAMLPAVVIAYDYYGDASREQEIIERNKIRNGGFVPAQALKLLSE